MAASLPNGAKFSIAKSYTAGLKITAVSNANPAVATCAGHGLVTGDIVSIGSGWQRLNGRALRVTVIDSDTFSLDKVDTSNTGVFPAGSGTGTARKVAGWQEIVQAMNPTMSGGEQQFATYQFLEEDDERQVPTNRSAQSIQIPIADDSSLPHWEVLESADQRREVEIVRLYLRNGDEIYYSAYVSVTDTPTLTANEVMTRTVNLAFDARPMRYPHN